MTILAREYINGSCRRRKCCFFLCVVFIKTHSLMRAREDEYAKKLFLILFDVDRMYNN